MRRWTTLDRSASQPSGRSRQMSSQMARVKDRAWCVVVRGREAFCSSREPFRSPRADCPVVLHLGSMSLWVSVYLNLLLPGLNLQYIQYAAWPEEKKKHLRWSFSWQQVIWTQLMHWAASCFLNIKDGREGWKHWGRCRNYYSWVKNCPIHW